MLKEVLRSGMREFVEGGLEEEEKGRLRLAATAYFKAVTQICDYLIFKKYARIPSSHTDRFRMLERGFPEIYKIVDRIFGVYRDTYSEIVTRNSCRLIKDELAEIIRLAGLEEDIKEIVRKIQG